MLPIHIPACRFEFFNSLGWLVAWFQPSEAKNFWIQNQIEIIICEYGIGIEVDSNVHPNCLFVFKGLLFFGHKPSWTQYLGWLLGWSLGVNTNLVQALCLSDQAYNCLIHLQDNCTVTVSALEDNLWRKTTFDGRWPFTEDNLWQKTTFDRRWPLTEDDLWRKMTFDRRQPLTEDDL